MNASDLYRIYLKASMLPVGKVAEVTIEKAELETVHPRPGETKKVIVLSFKNKVARLILNQGNANRMVALAGDDCDGWAGIVVNLRRSAYGQKETVIIEPATNGNGKK